MNTEDTMSRIARAVQEGEPDSLVAEVRGALDEPVGAERIQEAMMSGLRKVGELFSSGQCYLPEILLAAESFQQGMKLIEPRLAESAARVSSRGTVVIGTVLTDIHEIGKNVVVTLMRIHGLQVVDLGANVSRTAFLDEAQKARAEVIAMSALMTTTMTYQRDVIEHLKESGLRDRYVVLVGGGPVSEEWSREIGADGTSESAVGAVELAARLIAARQEGAS